MAQEATSIYCSQFYSFLSIMELGTLQREVVLVKGLGFRVLGPIRQRACATPCSLAITDPVLNLDGYERQRKNGE